MKFYETLQAMLKSFSLALTFLSALHSISIYNLLLSTGDTTLIHYYITRATQAALKEQRSVWRGDRREGIMGNMESYGQS